MEQSLFNWTNFVIVAAIVIAVVALLIWAGRVIAKRIWRCRGGARNRRERSRDAR